MKSWFYKLIPGLYEKKLAKWRQNLKGKTRAIALYENEEGHLVEKSGYVMYFHPSLGQYSFVPDDGGKSKFYPPEKLHPEHSL